MPGYKQKKKKKRSKNRSKNNVRPENVQPAGIGELRQLTLENMQVESYKKFLFFIVLLNNYGFTVFDVLHCFYTLPLEWQEYYLIFPEETERYIERKLGDTNLFRGSKKKKKTKKKK